jgi:hypothetical protein
VERVEVKPPFKDQLRANDAAQAYLAAASGKETPKQWLNNVPPKREYKRTGIPTEHQEQVAVIQWWGWHCASYGLPPFALFAVPNGGARDAIVGAKLKAEGVRRGAPDLILPVARSAYFGLFIELKRINASASDTSQEQRDFGAFLQKQGYVWEVCNGANGAIGAITEYLK